SHAGRGKYQRGPDPARRSGRPGDPGGHLCRKAGPGRRYRPTCPDRAQLDRCAGISDRGPRDPGRRKGPGARRCGGNDPRYESYFKNNSFGPYRCRWSDPGRRNSVKYSLFLLPPLALMGCGDLSQVGKAPEFSPLEGSYHHHAIYSTPMPGTTDPSGAPYDSSLWNASSESLLGDRRAARRGDILTVVIEIDDSAE